ncbi:MAG: type II toxin-antitoxin system Phd/YefM family antitoxin [Actinomycetota bacterium]
MTRVVSVSISELKAKLSEHLRLVKAGETVMVTERGRAVAQLSPPASSGEEDDLQELVDRGVIRRGRGSIPPEFWDLPQPADPEGKVLAALLEERRMGR